MTPKMLLQSEIIAIVTFRPAIPKPTTLLVVIIYSEFGGSCNMHFKGGSSHWSS